MKQVTLGIKKDGHTFFVKIMPYDSFCTYASFYDEYELSIIFGKNKYPRLKYKNLYFSGAITSRSKWQIYIINEKKIDCLVEMRNSCLFIKTADVPKVPEEFNEEQAPMVGNIVSQENQCLQEVDECIAYNIKLYKLIKAKDLFKEQLLELFAEEYTCFTEGSKNPNCFFRYCIQYFKNFIKSEEECPCIVQYIKANDVINKYPELKNYNIKEFVERAINIVAEEFKDHISIYYSREEVYDVIFDETMRMVRHVEEEKFKEKYSHNSEIESLIKEKLWRLKDKEILFQRIQFLISINEISNSQMIIEKADDLIDKCVKFEKICERFAYCDCTGIIEANQDKENQFSEFELGKIDLTKNERREYFIYKEVMPFYYESLYNKKRTKLKPSIEKIDSYVAFARSAIELLINTQIVLKKGDEFVYSRSGDFEKYRGDIKAILNID